MTEVCYPLDRIVWTLASCEKYSNQAPGLLISLSKQNILKTIPPRRGRFSASRIPSSSVCCPALANNMAKPSKPNGDATLSSLLPDRLTYNANFSRSSNFHQPALKLGLLVARQCLCSIHCTQDWRSMCRFGVGGRFHRPEKTYI